VSVAQLENALYLKMSNWMKEIKKNGTKVILTKLNNKQSL